MKENNGPHNGTWRAFSLWRSRLVAINSARLLVSMRIAARLDRVKNAQAVLIEKYG